MEIEPHKTIEESGPGGLARAGAFVKRHAVPIGVTAGSVALVVVGAAMPADMRRRIVGDAKKMLASDRTRRAAVIAAETVTTAATTEKHIERTFMGFSESQLNEIAQTVWHGVSAGFDDFGHLVFRYKSNLGKTIISALLSEEHGGIAINQGLCGPSNRSSLPGAFADRIFEEASKASQK